jgi:hypothetical protein
MLNRVYASPVTKELGGTTKGAVYGDEQNGFFIVLAAKSQRKITSPTNAVNVMKANWLSKGISDVKVFPVSSNGGTQACQETQQDVICFWADYVSIGFTLFSPGLASSLADGASKTAQIHSAVVQ